MKTTKMIIIILLAAFINANIANAQDKKEEKKHVYTLSTYKVNFGNMKDYLKLMEKYKVNTIENEFILSQKVFTHLWGPDWSIMIVTEYENLASIEKSQARNSELSKKNFTNKEEFEKDGEKWQSMILGHTDAIVKEVPSLTK